MTEAFPIPERTARKREDHRGWLQVIFESDTMVLKRSFSKAGVFRGLHVQTGPAAQVKLIRVVSGRILDFVVSLRDEERRIHRREIEPGTGWIQIEAEFAHGFYALEDSLFEYVCDGPYDESSERCFSILHHLKELGIENPILSDKDRDATPLEVAAGSEAKLAPGSS